MTNLSNTSNQQGTSPMPFGRYTPFVPVDVPDRTWPTKKVEKADHLKSKETSTFPFLKTKLNSQNKIWSSEYLMKKDSW